MRISIHTLGTRGDVQPYLALAIGLKNAGHDVMIAAPTQYESFIGTRGIGFAHLPGEFLELMEAPEAKAAMAGGGGFSAGLRMIGRFRPIARKQLTAEWHAAKTFQPELIIYHPKAIGAPHIGERLGCETVMASPLPGFTPTSDFASPMVPFRSVGPFNRLSHKVMANGGEAIFGAMIAKWRVSELGLAKRPPKPLHPSATLYAYSPTVLPRPRDWPQDVAVTGYWFLDDNEEWAPNAALQAFLDAGPPPIYIGFGSMPSLNSAQLTDVVTGAIRLAGVRAVIATGGGALDDIPDTDGIRVIDGAPHDRLFPLVDACVHHGGAGTTAAALRSGKSMVICSSFGDQPFWGRHMSELGVAPPPLEARNLTEDTLAAAILRATRSEQMRTRAEAIAASIGTENGVPNAIEFLERRQLLKPRPTALETNSLAYD